MASIDFYVANGIGGAFSIDTNSSGLGFYGSSFGSSVSVSEYSDSTYVTDSNGVTQGVQTNNVKRTDNQSGEVAGSTNLNLLDIPNSQTTLNIRFTHTSDVQVQNAELRIYDRNNINNGPSGVSCSVYETLHPSTTQTGNLGSGASTWTTPVGSSVTLDLAQSPGESGLAAQDGSSSTTEDSRHDWFVAISPRVDSIGSKLFGLYCSLEYL